MTMKLTATVEFEVDDYVLGHYIAGLGTRKAGAVRVDREWFDERIVLAGEGHPDTDDLLEWLLLGQVFGGRTGATYTGAADILEEILERVQA